MRIRRFEDDVMSLDFSTYFEEYEKLVSGADQAFARIQQACPDKVTCKRGCCDCCYALFDLTLVEAMYLNHHFKQLPPEVKNRVYLRADKADRKMVMAKKKAFRMQGKGESREEVLKMVGQEKIRCPFLGENDQCEMYEHRPITCRLYGVPQEINGKAHVCTLTGFAPGSQYPTVKVERLQDALVLLSNALVKSLNSKHTKLATVFVPVSSAVLTVYDEDYLGIEQEGQKAKKAQWSVRS
jgi:Fe-S-cluster containining protein